VLAHRRTHSPIATPEYRLSSSNCPINQQRLEIIHRYIRENLAGDIKQADIARTLALSPPAFSRFFQNATGKTFVTFVNTLRINEACRRLINTVLPVTEIAMACGYNNISNFNRRFVVTKKMSPTVYRRYAHQNSERQANYAQMRRSRDEAAVQL
jgi:transcriptional regulator GlxA family with amidase domain